jgi:hypothetical protein
MRLVAMLLLLLLGFVCWQQLLLAAGKAGALLLLVVLVVVVVVVLLLLLLLLRRQHCMRRGLQQRGCVCRGRRCAVLPRHAIVQLLLRVLLLHIMLPPMRVLAALWLVRRC